MCLKHKYRYYCALYYGNLVIMKECVRCRKRWRANSLSSTNLTDWLEFSEGYAKLNEQPVEIKDIDSLIRHDFTTVGDISMRLRRLAKSLSVERFDKRIGFIDKIKAVVTLLGE